MSCTNDNVCDGQAFSVFFVLIALTSDMICFLFIPVHWLFFAASTYVWVQYVIGYPVVTLGFGFKSYVSYRMRLRKQKEVAKENEFYVELLQKALPQEVPAPPPAPSLPPDTELMQTSANGVNHCAPNHQKKSSISSTNSDKSLIISNGSANKLICDYDSSTKKSIPNGIDRHELQYMEHQIIKKISSLNHFDNNDDNGVDDIVEHNNTTN
ncbi:unnamed protein product, partial [Oppiella nova]